MPGRGDVPPADEHQRQRGGEVAREEREPVGPGAIIDEVLAPRLTVRRGVDVEQAVVDVGERGERVVDSRAGGGRRIERWRRTRR
jgi:hypothetical protein